MNLKSEMFNDVSSTVELRRHYGKGFPAKLKSFREEIYKKEVGYLNESTLVNSWDELGVHLYLWNSQTEEVIACAHVYQAEKGEFAEYCGANPATLKTGVYITRVMVDPRFRGQRLVALICYLAMREARIWGRRRMFCFSLPGNIAARKAIGYEFLDQLNKRVVEGNDGKSFEFFPATQTLNEGMVRCFDTLDAEKQNFLKKYQVEEIEQTVENRLDDFFNNPWFKSIYSGKFNKEQYVRTLSNFYQFVRLTTRILARAVSLTPDKHLREHFLEHLQGEVDHEVMIERDLNFLGRDPNFVVAKGIPDIHTQQFMVIQESMLGYYEDSALYLAVPLSIEGFSASLSDEFLRALYSNIESWGTKPPMRAATFITSHVKTDGGDDGHWQKNVEAMHHLMKTRDEVFLQKFLNVTHLTMNSLEQCYAEFVSEPDFSRVVETSNVNSFENLIQVPKRQRSSTRLDSNGLSLDAI